MILKCNVTYKTNSVLYHLNTCYNCSNTVSTSVEMFFTLSQSLMNKNRYFVENKENRLSSSIALNPKENCPTYKDHLTPDSLVLSVRCDNSMLSVDVTNKTRPSAGDPTLTSHPQQRLLARSLLSQAGGVQQQHSP